MTEISPSNHGDWKRSTRVEWAQGWVRIVETIDVGKLVYSEYNRHQLIQCYYSLVRATLIIESCLDVNDVTAELRKAGYERVPHTEESIFIDHAMGAVIAMTSASNNPKHFEIHCVDTQKYWSRAQSPEAKMRCVKMCQHVVGELILN